MKVKDLFQDVNPFEHEKFLEYMKEAAGIITSNQDELSPNNYCDIMEFFGPKIQKWGELY